MKRIIAIVLALVFVVSLAACNGKKSDLTTKQNGVETVNKFTYQPSRILVAVFSQTNNTIDVASNICKALKADLLEIEAKEEYTKEDIDTSNDKCRAKQEADDPSARPEVKVPASYANEYDTVFIGYPIWYDSAPKVIYSFIDSFDFKGKNVYLFCTSKESSIKTSFNELKSTYPDVNIVDGRRFPTNATYDDVAAWLTEIGMYSQEAKE